MKCKYCTNETDNTSGICWECLNERYIRCPEYFTRAMTNDENTLTYEETGLIIEMYVHNYDSNQENTEPNQKD